MPQIKISHVVSFSSEDSNYPASNLTSGDIVNKIWVGQRNETSNSVVLQMEKSVHISQVHIGNYHSAFVEVLVGRSEAASQNYEVLVCANSFMNPADSRNSENITRVKTFSGDQLAADVKSKKWDRVRIVCTQPYNKHVQFGLSFIQIFSSESQSAGNTSMSMSGTQLGRFRLRKSSSEDEDIGTSFKPGELFARQKQGNLSIDAEIRRAGKPESLSQDKGSSLLIKTARPNKTNSDTSKTSGGDAVLSRKKDSLFYDDEDDERHEKIDRLIERDRDEKQKLSEPAPSEKEKKKKVIKETRTESPKPQKKVEKIVKPDKDDKARRSVDLKRQNENDDGPSAKKPCNAKPKRDTSAHQDESERSKRDTNSQDDSERSKRDASSHNELKRPKRDINAQDDLKRPKRNINTEDEGESIVHGEGCLRGVVFVLSGYVNPKRSTLRDTAISLGARYAPDWAPHCTHLVCAFANTPKHDQVKKSSPDASIVTGQWIEECGKERAHLPWKWFALDPNQRTTRPDGPITKPQQKKPDQRTDDYDEPGTSRKMDKKRFSESESDTDDEIEKAMREYEKKESQKKREEETKKPVEESGSDTDIDEEIQQKYVKKNVENDSKKTPEKIDDPYSANTPVKKAKKDDTYNSNTQVEEKKSQSPMIDSGMEESLPDLFQFTKFYVDPNLENTKYDVKEIKRYIIAYGGEVMDRWPNKKVDVAVTHEDFVSELRFEGDKRCIYLRPEWIWKCNDTETLQPYENYCVS